MEVSRTIQDCQLDLHKLTVLGVEHPTFEDMKAHDLCVSMWMLGSPTMIVLVIVASMYGPRSTLVHQAQHASQHASRLNLVKHDYGCLNCSPKPTACGPYLSLSCCCFSCTMIMHYLLVTSTMDNMQIERLVALKTMVTPSRAPVLVPTLRSDVSAPIPRSDPRHCPTTDLSRCLS